MSERGRSSRSSRSSSSMVDDAAISWELTLDQPSYVAGNVIRGTARLTAAEAIVLNAVGVTIHGSEVVTWVEGAKDLDGSVTEASYSRRSEALRDEVGLLTVERAFEAGTHELPFEYSLPIGIPGGYQFKCARVGDFANVSAELEYTMELNVSEISDEETRTETVASFSVQVLRPQTWRPRNVRALAGETIRIGNQASLQHSVSTEIVNATSTVEGHFLSAIIDSVTHFPGDTIKVLCRVERDPSDSSDLEEIVLALHEDLTLTVASDRSGSTSKVVVEQRYPLPPPGSPLEQVFALEVPSELAPSLNSCFVQWQYRLEVVGTLHGQKQRLSVDFPVAMLL